MASKSDLPPSVPGTASRDGFKESEEGETEGPRESDGADHVTPGAAAGHALGPSPPADLKPRLDISLPVTDFSIVPGDAENPDRLRRRREIREKQQQAERYLRAMGQVRPAHATLDIPWQERLLECVLKMKPDAFERLCQRILKESGFIKVDVTGRGGDGALGAESIDEIAELLGNDYRRKLTPLKESRWAHDRFARGSYSHALPGHADKRAVLAAPIDGRLFFAGEATSLNFFSTAHGARDSGERAAREVLGG